MTPKDPVHYLAERVYLGEYSGWEEPGWYFWDETWADRIGPYITEEEARKELRRYCIEFLGYADDD